MENLDIRLRVLMLEAQMGGTEAEIRKLREIPCPKCQFSSQQGTIEIKLEDGIRYETCEDCNGTGYACGERGTFR